MAARISKAEKAASAIKRVAYMKAYKEKANELKRRAKR